MGAVGGRDEPVGFTEHLAQPDFALDTDDEAVDPTFDLDASLKSDRDHMIETFC